ncbi:MAG TPA: hypothetical protein VKV95_03665 [Terriglobia bacterium]|nr:hypothetical protein [Terriglobia bacterium]
MDTQTLRTVMRTSAPIFSSLSRTVRHSGYSNKDEPRRLLVTPIYMRKRMAEMIQREIAHQERGETGHLIFKMNALEDPEMIRLLYRASQAGVKVELVVRGICCLRPGVSDNIRVTSVVGRFLEHSRVFYFRNGGAEEIYLGSVDLMRRNLSHRIEIIFPVKNPKLLRRLKDTLGVYLSDQAKAQHLQADGTYNHSAERGQPGAVNCQAALLALQREAACPDNSASLPGRKRRAANGQTNGSPRAKK